MADGHGWTPIIEPLARERGLVSAAVFGIVQRHCKMASGVCDASLETMAEMIGSERSTVLRHIKKLCEDGYLKDLTPTLRNSPHIYEDTGKVELMAQIDNVSDKSVVMRNSLDNGSDNSVAHNNSSTPTVAHSNSSKDGSDNSVAESHLKKEDVVHDEMPGGYKQLPTFEILHNRWLDNNLGKLAPRQVELFGDYYDEHPDWVSEIIDTTIGGKPDNPWQYFVKIINSWVKNGKPAQVSVEPRREGPARSNSPPSSTTVRNGSKSPPIDADLLEQLQAGK